MTVVSTGTGPRWESQQYPPEGAAAAEGIRSQLGRPALDLLTVLVREAAQNSWDARSGGIDVSFGLDLYTVSPAHAPTWRSLLLEGGPRNSDIFPLRKALGQTSIRVLAVSDRGTKGLGGPTRADVVTDGPRDFVTFVRNVGEPRDTRLGGGTYGFGKGIFFMLSQARTVLIHTRTLHEGRLQTRLVGSALAHSYTMQTLAGGEARYTGRHWWGRPVDNVIEPLLDDEADDVAGRLGLRPFGHDETGTTVVVVDPEIDETLGSASDVGTYLAETIMWQLWPKMLPRHDRLPAMSFRVTVDGQEYEIPDPVTTHPIQMFVEAYRLMNSPEARSIELGRPRRRLGVLGLHASLVLPWTPTRAAETAGFTKNLVHHVCLMRSAELVVTYRPGIEPAAELKGYAGVFRVAETLDEVFARAEPPTHDAWNADSLSPDERRYVNGVFRRLREAQTEINGLQVSVGSSNNGMALGAASNYFSALVRGSAGFGGRHAAAGGQGAVNQAPVGQSPSATPGTASRARSRAGDDYTPTARVRVEYVGDPFLTIHEGARTLVQEFRLSGAQTARVDAKLSIATAIDAAGRDRDLLNPPQVLGWTGPDGNSVDASYPVTISDDRGIWRLLVRPTEDTMTVVEIQAEAVHL
ncbi:hypothetical protein [Isoptericola sp. NPDC057653]|uniref:hypothetical protein n=1 Tax=Isoptericola sp. NPDC057653 TaxID=3346195 RepID=UPI0036A1B55E